MAVFSAGTALVACGGGGGGGGSPISPATVTPTTPTPTPTQTTSSMVIPAAGGTLTLFTASTGGSGGYAGSVTVPAPSTGAGATLTSGVQTTLPAGLPALQSGARRPLADTPLLYVSLSVSTNVAFPTSPSFQIVLPSSAASGVQYYLAECIANACSSWQLAAIGPATVSGSTLSFAATNNSVFLTAGVTYWFVLYTAPTSTPTPTPTITPVPGPSGPATSFTARPNTAEITSTFSIQSNPAGLGVAVNGVNQGVTPQNFTPAFSSSAYTITIAPANGNGTYTYTTDQIADGNHPVYYNQNADTSGSIGSVSASSIARSPQSITSQNTSGVPRFTATHLAGRPLYSSTRVAVHYLTSALAMGGRRAQDVEHFEGVGRAVAIGFERDGQATRIADVPSGQTAASLVRQMKGHAEVAGAEPLGLRYKASSTAVTPNDTHYNNYDQWDMFKIGAPNAWGYTTGVPQTGNTPSPSTCSIVSGVAPTSNPGVNGIAVAIIDTGLDNNLQDFQGGKVVYGEKVVGGVVTCGVAAAQDTDGHGSNVSGIAAAATNNAIGFAGVGYNVSLQIYKIFNDGPSDSIGADTGDEAQAIYDAVAHGARVLSLSLGGPQAGGFDPVERDAIEYAVNNNVTVVAAAGNEATTTLDLPGGYDGVISVGATSLSDAPNYKQYSTAIDVMAGYSNYGPRLTVVAPGGDPPGCESAGTPTCTGYTGVDILHWIENLYTTTPYDPTQACSNINDCRALFAGTSQATPHVAGAVALMLSRNPNLTTAQITQILESTADDIGDSRQGHGRLNVYRALAQVAGDNSLSNGLPLPGNTNFVAFAYTNSGAINAAPAIIDQTYTKGYAIGHAGTFRLADILPSAATYKCAVWADLNGDGKVDSGDWFGVATGSGTGSTPCSGATGIVAHPITTNSFQLP
jgi:subtilisin family serine protease